MLQLLLVDDERSVVETLAETIPWADCGVGTVHEALSGAMALDVLENNAIDIVITDIRMPGMSGLELIAAIQSRWPHIRTILLSGYADFEYAKQAITQQTFDYLLKPVSDEDLIDSVSRVVGQIKAKWEEAASYHKALYALSENLPLLRSSLLSELLTGKTYLEEALVDKLQLLELPYAAGDETGMLLIRMEERFAELPGQDLSLMEYAICNIVNEVMQDNFYIWPTRDDHDYIVILVKVKEMASRMPRAGIAPSRTLLERYAAQIQLHVQNYLKGGISILVGGWGMFPAQIRETYAHAVMSMRKKMGQGQGLFVTTAQEADIRQDDVHTIWSLYEPPTLLSLLEAGRFDDIERKIRTIFEELQSDKDVSEQLTEAYHVLAGAFAYIIHKNGKQLQTVLAEDTLRYFQAPSYTTASQLHDWAIRTLGQIRSDTEQELKDSHSAIVRGVRSFVDRHLAQDVSLPAIADYVHLHPVYLSKVYKAETGEALTEYVYRLRMEKAAFYLRTTAAKVLEVAEMVGYNNTAYFIRVFKKFYDLTPQEYRDRLQQ
ncbi:two-component system response regulator YesN [Paenibacillus phyllosphaerae]|uniref:Two-component system response regulator YesN n=1 Tax=Paenibacillus phyllosphaerae TaxID=274593 RepID=A0A7W5AU58_9BACL|nr:response regulator [Paenibacillus phyllosphaerae]MBB3108845.1 two-component system response regulator YesN [Paenibacillus phyllosphaerae]